MIRVLLYISCFLVLGANIYEAVVAYDVPFDFIECSDKGTSESYENEQVRTDANFNLNTSNVQVLYLIDNFNFNQFSLTTLFLSEVPLPPPECRINYLIH